MAAQRASGAAVLPFAFLNVDCRLAARRVVSGSLGACAAACVRAGNAGEAASKIAMMTRTITALYSGNGNVRMPLRLESSLADLPVAMEVSPRPPAWRARVRG